jgi:hypothetical protein
MDMTPSVRRLRNRDSLIARFSFQEDLGLPRRGYRTGDDIRALMLLGGGKIEDEFEDDYD